jgi:transcriptional regulator with XRE-family HTH domain
LKERELVVNGFRVWLQKVLADTFGGNQSKMAAALGISNTHIGRLLKTGEAGAETVLRLATFTGCDASDLLRQAGHGVIAGLIEECYGPARAISPNAKAILDALEEFPELAPIKAAELRTLQAVLRSQSKTRSGHAGPPGGGPNTPKKPRVRDR